MYEQFGDSEPEDAWDASDPLQIKQGNLDRRLDILETAPRWGEPQRVRLYMVKEDVGGLRLPRNDEWLERVLARIRLIEKRHG